MTTMCEMLSWQREVLGLLGFQYAIGIASILFLFLFAASSARSKTAAPSAIHGVLVTSSPVGTSHT